MTSHSCFLEDFNTMDPTAFSVTYDLKQLSVYTICAPSTLYLCSLDNCGSGTVFQDFPSSLGLTLRFRQGSARGWRHNGALMYFILHTLPLRSLVVCHWCPITRSEEVSCPKHSHPELTNLLGSAHLIRLYGLV